ncbi:hypothetical protein BKA62DRAFT_696700 [Auriculariales sp. MPI-PUGE-AT-0066]|nr:hypothetical protein BKA62DRAFT_696700 [Auriculariales sp. MPI-PUGE-AT-0066]
MPVWRSASSQRLTRSSPSYGRPSLWRVDQRSHHHSTRGSGRLASAPFACLLTCSVFFLTAPRGLRQTMSQRGQLLCMSCASSPSPKASSNPIFLTPCCSRPICANCIGRNPRLRDYDPCLACLGGASAVRRSASSHKDGIIRATPKSEEARREAEMFILGDSDDDDDDDTGPVSDSTNPAGTGNSVGAAAAESPIVGSNGPPDGRGIMISTTYFIQPGDTLALRFGSALMFVLFSAAVPSQCAKNSYLSQGWALAKLNNIPLSTLSTTPHLLHARRSIQLPPGAKNLHNLPPPPDPAIEARHRLERAQKRFQLVTKEADWRIARAYVSLAEDQQDNGQIYISKEGSEHKRPANAQPEHLAVDHYLDDDEWERAQGNGRPSIPTFPLKA